MAPFPLQELAFVSGGSTGSLPWNPHTVGSSDPFPPPSAVCCPGPKPLKFTEESVTDSGSLMPNFSSVRCPNEHTAGGNEYLSGSSVHLNELVITILWMRGGKTEQWRTVAGAGH